MRKKEKHPMKEAVTSEWLSSTPKGVFAIGRR